ncbi:MAG: hypothetical protein JWL83_836 [Actinomycetia bacterium]|jgi:uncharacterized protein (TIGR00266 family)|nr:hypothetical protein [Actinomycetes bacterium]
MDVTVRHNPSFAVARCALGANEAVKVEAGAMMATSTGVTLDAKMEGGLLKSLKRATLGGESLFITTFTAPADGGWIDVAANLPGDIAVTGVTAEQSMFIQRGSWLCNSDGVSLETKWGGMPNLFGGEGGFVVRASGHGTTVLGCYGALDTISLQPGETFVLDTGHMVAYAEGVQMQLRRAGNSLGGALKSSEGLVFEFTGPGWVMTQSRNPKGLVGWLTANLPGQRD